MVGHPAPLSGRNPRIATLRRLLGRRGARHAAGRFVLEGRTLLDEVVAASSAGLVELHEVYVDAEAPDLDAVVATVAPTGASVLPVVAGVVERVASTSTSQPILAVASIAWARPEVLTAGPVGLGSSGSGPVAVLVDVGDPGNVGTLVRSAAAAGARAVVVAGSTADPWGPKAVRASAGAVLRVPLVDLGTSAVVEALREAGLAVVATVVDGGAPPERVPLTGPVAILLGSEAHGLPEAVVAAADERVGIPMVAGTESLNVAMAGTVLLFEAARQERTPS